MVVVFCIVELEELRSLGYWDAAEELVCTIFSLEQNKKQMKNMLVELMIANDILRN